MYSCVGAFLSHGICVVIGAGDEGRGIFILEGLSCNIIRKLPCKHSLHSTVVDDTGSAVYYGTSKGLFAIFRYS